MLPFITYRYRIINTITIAFFVLSIPVLCKTTIILNSEYLKFNTYCCFNKVNILQFWTVGRKFHTNSMPPIVDQRSRGYISFLWSECTGFEVYSNHDRKFQNSKASSYWSLFPCNAQTTTFYAGFWLPICFTNLLKNEKTW